MISFVWFIILFFTYYFIIFIVIYYILLLLSRAILSLAASILVRAHRESRLPRRWNTQVPIHHSKMCEILSTEMTNSEQKQAFNSCLPAASVKPTNAMRSTMLSCLWRCFLVLPISKQKQKQTQTNNQNLTQSYWSSSWPDRHLSLCASSIAPLAPARPLFAPNGRSRSTLHPLRRRSSVPTAKL